MVGCVLVRDRRIVGEGWHAEFGGSHAEIMALKSAGQLAKGSTVYVTLEPCCHQGKTPPCSQALVHVGVERVVSAMEDPFPPVDGGGLRELHAAGIECSVGTLAGQARELNAPYLKRLNTGRPWVIAKWAATQDGKLALPPSAGRWISNDASREVVQQLRGRVDAIIVGSGTVRADDPLLTARPKNPDYVKRRAVRVVVDSNASLSLDSRLVKTANEVPVLLAVAAIAPVEKCRQLVAAGTDIFPCAGANHAERFASLLEELGRRRVTNVLVEGGSRLLVTLFEARLVDEAHVFTSSKIAGDENLPNAPEFHLMKLHDLSQCDLDGDSYICGRMNV